MVYPLTLREILDGREPCPRIPAEYRPGQSAIEEGGYRYGDIFIDARVDETTCDPVAAPIVATAKELVLRWWVKRCEGDYSVIGTAVVIYRPGDRRREIVITREMVDRGCAGLDQARAESGVYKNDELGIQFTHPTAWQVGSPPNPYVACPGCAVFGPKQEPTHAYGMQLFVQEVDLDGPFCGGSFRGCPVTAFVGNRALPQGAEERLLVDGRNAARQEIERQAPLGMTEDTGDGTPYREIWTAVSLGDRALMLVAFYLEGDATAERETRAAYGQMVGSLRFTR